MGKTSLLALSFFLFFACFGTFAQSGARLRLADLKSLYLDEGSFRFRFSSCGHEVAGMILPCPEHASERFAFLTVLKRWLIKSGFIVVDNEKDADGILRGTLSIDENFDSEKRHRKHHDTNEPEYRYGPVWNVQAWLTDQSGRRFWTLGLYPSISYSGGLAKFHGKSVAKALEHDRKHSK